MIGQKFMVLIIVFGALGIALGTALGNIMWWTT
jgi:hypothetical protein